ncbi:MAG: PEP-CTERM sorting domain-containing protein [Chitinivibrionales bacterium]|nr:PEP-CTERM sorting domain-containing protein [Chitinivibrionales bacterium]MBD3356411.1 PEP-CTERM sorting domain-containing protein [Chitinivibrionales bacterium]
MKKLLKPVTLLAACSAVAMAAPMSLYDVGNDDGAENNYWEEFSGYDATIESELKSTMSLETPEHLTLTDTDGSEDDAAAFMFLEFSGWSAENIFGIYEFEQDASGDVVVKDMLEIFDGDDRGYFSGSYDFGMNSTQVVSFDLANNECWVDETNKKQIDETFGVYITAKNGQTYYSHDILNGDDMEHFKMFNIPTSLDDFLQDCDVVLGIEDADKEQSVNALGGWDEPGDFDYNDMVIGMRDVTVPEPGTVSLVGFGILSLLGMGWTRKRKS